MTQDPIQQIRASISPVREQVIAHPAFSGIQDLESLRIFMRHHVYAVWDFMSLLKALQNQLTCTSVPWFPKGSPDTRYLINEIVVGEECDVDPEGCRLSHFELYLNAMRQAGAETDSIQTFIRELETTGNFNAAFEKAETPQEARDFVNFTFEIINSGKDYLMAAVFTFGREDLIPGMFHSLVNDLDNAFPGNLQTFRYYLERHIEVDGGHHSQLALEMTERLCGRDPLRWQEVSQAVQRALQMRKHLWNGVARQLSQLQTQAAFNG